MPFSAERLKTYTDAVVAIAQTLLILPLLESAAAAHAQSWTAAQWLAHERDAVIWFALSFMLIGTFWLEHERVYRHIERPNGALHSLNLLWMFGIVCFPVVTSLLALPTADPLQKGLYLGSMVVCSWSLAATLWITLRDPQLRGELPPPGSRSIAAAIAGAVLYGLAFLVGMLIPGAAGFLALFLLMAMPAAVRIVAKRLDARKARA